MIWYLKHIKTRSHTSLRRLSRRLTYFRDWAKKTHFVRSIGETVSSEFFLTYFWILAKKKHFDFYTRNSNCGRSSWHVTYKLKKKKKNNYTLKNTRRIHLCEQKNVEYYFKINVISLQIVHRLLCYILMIIIKYNYTNFSTILLIIKNF